MIETAIDLFAGAGGFTEGAEGAGVKVLWAANHWPAAVETHAANHPHTLHLTQDLQQADWTCVPKHDLLLASPACQGHSNARGTDRPHHDATRSTAWAVVSALECHRTPFAIVENVPEFLKWKLYRAWELAVSDLGYSVAQHIVDAADHGVPQNRKRLFMVLARSKRPLWLNLPKRAQHVPISQVIDWSAGSWSPIDKIGRAKNTLERIRNGRSRFGERFLVVYYGRDNAFRSLDRPIGTITTANRYALVDGDRMRLLIPREVQKAMGFRDTYVLPEKWETAMRLLGNAVCPIVATDLINLVRASA